MKTIMLYGFLGKKFGKVHRFNVKTPSEAVKALTANYPNFRKEVIQGGAYKVLIGGKQSIKEENLLDPVSDKESIRIVPVVQGSGGSPIGNIIFGAALVFFSGGTALPGLLGAVGMSAAGATLVSAMAYSFGISLVLGGLSQLLFPAPKAENTDTPEHKASFSFNGAVNTIAQGNPVPVCYGKLIVGSQVVSAGFSTEDIPI